MQVNGNSKHVSLIKVACACISLPSLNVKENEANTKSTVAESTTLSNR